MPAIGRLLYTHEKDFSLPALLLSATGAPTKAGKAGGCTVPGTGSTDFSGCNAAA